jgi:hypothetical protein
VKFLQIRFILSFRKGSASVTLTRYIPFVAIQYTIPDLIMIDGDHRIQIIQCRQRSKPNCFFFFKVSKIRILTLQKIQNKIPRRTQCCALSLCKFLEENMFYFGLSKNNKLYKKTKLRLLRTVHHCSLRSKFQFIISSEPKLRYSLF